LTYTSFTYTSLECQDFIKVDAALSSASLTLQVTVRNDGAVAGSEIIQVYVSDPSSTLPRPDAELKGFAKVHLESGEEKVAVIELDRDAFAFWNDKHDAWVTEKGEFVMKVGASYEDVRLTKSVHLQDTLSWRGL
jgi:beta-glucosidase